MNRSRFFLTIVICFVIAQNNCAQQYFTKTYTIENGLPTRIVNDVCQDSNGYMWFATNSGISSYDGFCFTNYNASNGLPQQHYRKVKFDEVGNLWGVPFSLSDTIVCMKNRIWTKIIPASGRTNLEVSSFDLFYRDGKPVICLGSYFGLDIYQNGHWNHIDVSKVPGQNQIYSVTSRNGSFFVLTKAGVFIVDQQKNGWQANEYFKTKKEVIITIKFERPGKPGEKLWMLSCTRLGYLQDGKYTLFADGFTLPETYIPGVGYLNFDNRGNFFFGNNWAKYFVNRIHGNAFPLLVKNGFSSNGASSVFIDREQNVWFTDSRGIDKVSNVLLVRYFESNGLLENEVTSIVELAGGAMAFGHNNGLTVMDHNKVNRITLPVLKRSVPRVLDMLQDDLGNLWFAANSLGFGKLNTDGKIKWYKVDSASVATTVLQDSHGKIWLGSNRKLFYIQNDNLVPYEHNDKLRCTIRKIFSTGTGELVCVGMGGMDILTGDIVKSVPVADDVKTNSIFSYYKSRSGAEYVGTLNGLCVVENGMIRKFNQQGIRIDSPVYFIFQDNNQNFWIGSNNGLLKWDGKNKLETFSLKNGLSGRETNRSAGVVDSHGSVWVGTDLGLTCFLPGFSNLKTMAPEIKLLAVEDSKGKYYSLKENCSIGFNDNTLFFHFRGISFVNEDLISYRYKLDGFDRDWQFVKQSNLDKVKYGGLQPGKYRIIVQSRLAAGDWSAVAKSEIITIRSSVYHTWWFNLLLFVGICAMIIGIIKIILQRKYSLKLEGEISERKRSEQRTEQTLQALHASEIKYRGLIEFAVDGFLMGSKEGIITGVNSYMQDLTGRSAEKLIGSHVNQLFSKVHLHEVPLRFDLLEQGEVVVSHRNVHRPDGTMIPVEMHTKMMPDGSYQSIYHDITKRKQAEAQLHKSRELYKLIADKMTDVVWLMDLNGRSTFVSPSIEQFTGFSMEEYLKQTIDDRFAPDSVAVVKHLFASELIRLKAQPETLKGYSNTQRMEYICKNGGTKWGELLMTPFVGENNEWLGIHGVTRDITDRKLAEEAVKEKANELERFNSLMIGRELKMIELKKEINELLVKADKPEKYVIHE